ncbi:recombinase family protein [Aliikangiella sp. IMCC44359]|uniref:recombinase family protein n=1 Tax=Aliikangiella sp. IMCC44359 TaxID=3459125 RepID=UPI00403A9898
MWYEKLGYIRTSTDKQLAARQVNQLQEFCDEVFIEDGVSSVKKKYPVYDAVIGQLQPNDTFVVSSLDRAFRPTIDALTELEKLNQNNIRFVSLSQNFDITTPDGKFLYTLAAALATWEREILSRRTKEGLEAAKRRGKTLGRPKKFSKADIEEARRILESDFYSSIVRVAESFSVHEKTLERVLDDME